MNRHLATLVLLLVLFSGTAAAQTTRGFVGISAGLQSGSEGFSHSATLESPLFRPEDGILAAPSRNPSLSRNQSPSRNPNLSRWGLTSLAFQMSP